MGYRSHVALSLATNEVVTACLSSAEVATALSSADRKYTQENFIIYEWDWSKWYESFPEVQTITKLMDELDARNDESDEDLYLYMFLRNGEDLNDMEHRGNWNMGISYDILIDGTPDEST